MSPDRNEIRTRVEKPRTRAFHDVKAGVRKMPGKVVIADEGRSLSLVRERLPDRTPELGRVKESLDRPAARGSPRPTPPR